MFLYKVVLKASFNETQAYDSSTHSVIFINFYLLNISVSQASTACTT
jgi:hypothetical protein